MKTYMVFIPSRNPIWGYKGDTRCYIISDDSEMSRDKIISEIVA